MADLQHCLDLYLNHQKTIRYFWQQFHILEKIWKLKYEYKREKNFIELFLRAALSSQSAKFWKIAKMILFNPCMKFEILGGKMTLFEVVKNFQKALL